MIFELLFVCLDQLSTPARGAPRCVAREGSRAPPARWSPGVDCTFGHDEVSGEVFSGLLIVAVLSLKHYPHSLLSSLLTARISM